MARVFSLVVIIVLLVFGSSSLSGADSGSADNRDIVVDDAIGGMREGSRIAAPDNYAKKTEIQKVPGTWLSPTMDTRVAAGAPVGGTSVAAGTAEAGNFPGGSSSGTLTGVNEGSAGAGGLGIETPSGTEIETQSVTGIETPSGTGTGVLEGGGATISEEPIVGAEPGAGTEPGLEGNATADSGGGSLIEVDANADLSSGSVDAGVSLDTDNTDKILDADLTAGAGEVGDVTTSTDIAASDLAANSELPLETTESAISSETDIGTEVDTSGGTVGGEANIGVEADVEGGTESVDVADDPADGLPAPGL